MCKFRKCIFECATPHHAVEHKNKFHNSPHASTLHEAVKTRVYHDLYVLKVYFPQAGIKNITKIIKLPYYYACICVQRIRVRPREDTKKFPDWISSNY